MNLKEWLTENRYSNKEFSEMLAPPVSPQAVSMWITRGSTPPLKRVMEIQKVTKGKVKPADWITQND